MLSDVGIRRALDKDIVIVPFDKDLLTATGYDFTVGDLVIPIEQEPLEPTADNIFHIPPKTTVRILTREAVWISARIGGTFHSKVALVTKGFAPVSGVLHPHWQGPLLMTMRNNTDSVLPLRVGERFTQLVFYRLSAPTQTRLPANFAYRKDLLMREFESYSKATVVELNFLLSDFEVSLEEFNNRVQKAKSTNLLTRIRKIWDVVTERDNRWKFALTVLLSLLSIVTLLLPVYWNRINWLFGSIRYDSTVFAAQVGVLTLLVGSIYGIWKGT